MKILYLAVRSRQDGRQNPTGRIDGWKTVLNALTTTTNNDGDRLTNPGQPADQWQPSRPNPEEIEQTLCRHCPA